MIVIDYKKKSFFLFFISGRNKMTEIQNKKRSKSNSLSLSIYTFSDFLPILYLVSLSK